MQGFINMFDDKISVYKASKVTGNFLCHKQKKHTHSDLYMVNATIHKLSLK